MKRLVLFVLCMVFSLSIFASIPDRIIALQTENENIKTDIDTIISQAKQLQDALNIRQKKFIENTAVIKELQDLLKEDKGVCGKSEEVKIDTEEQKEEQKEVPTEGE